MPVSSAMNDSKYPLRTTQESMRLSVINRLVLKCEADKTRTTPDLEDWIAAQTFDVPDSLIVCPACWQIHEWYGGPQDGNFGPTKKSKVAGRRMSVFVAEHADCLLRPKIPGVVFMALATICNQLSGSPVSPHKYALRLMGVCGYG